MVITLPISYTPTLPSPELELRLKKHLIYHAQSKAFNYTDNFNLGTEEELSKTAIKISTEEAILNFFKEANIKKNLIPPLSPGKYLVACIKDEYENPNFNQTQVYAVYCLRKIKEVIRTTALMPRKSLHWKILEIPTDLLNKLHSEIDIPKKKIYVDPERYDEALNEDSDYFVIAEKKALQVAYSYCALL